MRGFADLPVDQKTPAAAPKQPCREAPPGHARVFSRQDMGTLCPNAFGDFGSFKEAPEPARRMAAEVARGTLKLYDPNSRLEGATQVDESTAKTKANARHQRVLSVVETGGGAGAEAYGSEPMDVVVPGYRPGAKAYYLESR